MGEVWSAFAGVVEGAVGWAGVAADVGLVLGVGGDVVGMVVVVVFVGVVEPEPETGCGGGGSDGEGDGDDYGF